MRRWNASLILLLVLVFDSGPTMGASGETDPASQLLRLSEAIRKAMPEARYEAEQVVYSFTGDKTVATRFRVKYAYPYRKRECIEGPEKNRVVILEDGKFHWSYFPARKVVVKEPLREGDSPFPLCPTLDVKFLLQNYRVQILGPVPVDGMQCRVVSFVPRLRDRPRREWWLEDKWNVPIRVSVSTSDGRPAYRTELQKIRWNVKFKPEAFALKVPRDTRLCEVREQEHLSIDEARRLLKRPVVLPGMIPAGYRLRDVVLRAEGPRQCLQMVYTDGLSSFSFFQEWARPGMAASLAGTRAPVEGAPSVAMTRRHGLMNVATLPGPDRRTVLVGDLSQERLSEMAESIREAIRKSLGKSLEKSFRLNPSSP